MPAPITRRRLALGLAIAPGVLSAAPRPAAESSNDLQSARERYHKNTEKLTRIEIPMATEPAFQFKAR